MSFIFFLSLFTPPTFLYVVKSVKIQLNLISFDKNNHMQCTNSVIKYSVIR